MGLRTFFEKHRAQITIGVLSGLILAALFWTGNEAKSFIPSILGFLYELLLEFPFEIFVLASLSLLSYQLWNLRQNLSNLATEAEDEITEIQQANDEFENLFDGLKDVAKDIENLKSKTVDLSESSGDGEHLLTEYQNRLEKIEHEIEKTSKSLSETHSELILRLEKLESQVQGIQTDDIVILREFKKKRENARDPKHAHVSPNLHIADLSNILEWEDNRILSSCNRLNSAEYLSQVGNNATKGKSYTISKEGLVFLVELDLKLG